jgi:alkylhydroperoxidase/carboxymuconolactone decarboxylase family protein YurZ
MEDDVRARGKVLREALGIGESIPVSEVAGEFTDFGGRYAYGEVWSRPGLDLKTRSCITIAILTALVRPDYLATHLKAGLRLGLSTEEMREVIFHTSVYAGITAGAQGMAVARTVFAEEDGQANEKSR